jgi:hypothetical protein
MNRVWKPAGQQSIANEIKAIKKEAEDLSNFTGQEDYAEDAGFAGEDDEDNSAFVGQAKRNAKAQTFKFQLTNNGASAADRDLAIVPGLFTTEAALTAYGIKTDGILKTGGVIPGAAAAAQVNLVNLRAETVEMLQQFLRHNPSRLIGMTLAVSDPAQFETEMSITRTNPFRKEGVDQVDLSGYYSPDQFSSKKVEVDLINVAEDLTLGNQSTFMMKLLAGQTVIITLRFGGVNNQEKKFDRRARQGRNMASQKLAAMGSQRRAR